MHSRRARPTLRLLAEDLSSGWESPYPRRLLAEDRVEELHPLSELPHPIIHKALECFGSEPTDDTLIGTIRSSTTVRLLEVKVGQWRGGVWEDPDTQIRWLIVAGLAKGDHVDHDDVYATIARADQSGAITSWLPTERDRLLLKRETLARLLTEWELSIQATARDALARVQTGGSTSFDIRHPIQVERLVARVILRVTEIRETGYAADEIDVEIAPDAGFTGSDLAWQLALRVLITLSPPEQGWDRFRDHYSNIGEPDCWVTRVVELSRLVEDGQLEESVRGQHSHYTHRVHLAGKTIEGRAARALCGVFFVPTQDHASRDVCPSCQERLEELPRSG